MQVVREACCFKQFSGGGDYTVGHVETVLFAELGACFGNFCIDLYDFEVFLQKGGSEFGCFLSFRFQVSQ